MRIRKKMAPSVAVVGCIDRAAGLAIAALLLALFATSPLYAEGEHWYVGGGLGLAAYSEDESNAVCSEFSLSCEQDEDSVSFKLFGGYRFNPFISVEGGFSDWGDVNVTTRVLSAEVLGFTGSGVYVAAIPELPLGKHFSIFGELGATLVDMEVRVLDAGPLGALIGGTESENVWAPVYGAGVAGNLKHWTFRLQWERIDPDTDFDFGLIKIASPTLDVLGISVIYRF